MSMTRAEVFKSATDLPREEQIVLVQLLQQHLSQEARHSFRPGDKVKFLLKNGAVVYGTVERVNQKSVKVASKQDRYGREGAMPTTWAVSPQLLQSA